MDSGKLTGVIYIDLKKAFDTVDHGLLIKKMGRYGIANIELNWFHSYLSNRRQTVTVNGEKSEPMEITYGVPQGSIMGPLMFNMYVNDLPDVNTKSRIVMYADDTAIVFTDSDPRSIQTALNQDLALVKNWLDENKLTLNAKKTKFMVFGTRRRLKKCRNIRINLENEEIERVETFKYLGVWLDEVLNFNAHVEKLSKKISSMMMMMMIRVL